MNVCTSRLTMEFLWTNFRHNIVEWADLATLDLSLFDKPGGKEQLAKQLHEAIQKIGM